MKCSCQSFQKLERMHEQDRHTETHTQTHIQTDATERIRL